MGFLSGIVKSVAGPVLGGVLGIAGGERQNSAAAASQEAANAFTEKQLKNRHQWEVADLRKAGLNPTLSANGTPSIGGSQAAPVVDSISRGASSAAQVLSMQNARSQNDLLREQIKKTAAETVATAADARRIGAIADKEEISKLPYNIARDYLMPHVKSTAADVVSELKKSGISIKMGKGDFR